MTPASEVTPGSRSRATVAQYSRLSRQPAFFLDLLLSGILLLSGAATAHAAPATPGSPTPGTIAAPGPVQPAASVTLGWGAVTGATYYDLGVRDLTTDILVVDTTTTGTSFLASLAANRPYRWNVAACNATGCSTFTNALA
jgi:hypothetical protein